MGGFCGGGGGSSNNSGGNDNNSSSSSSGNSFTETLANIFTPNDGASYVNGVLVDDRTGDRLSSGDTTSAGRTVSASANDTSNDDNPIPASFTSTLPAPVTNTSTYNETQTDDKWGYTRADGTTVSAFQDMIDGGGKNFGGESFGISGGELADLNGDGYVTNAEANETGGLNENFVSKISNASGATPLGSGLEPTGVAGVLNMPIVGSALTGGLAGLYTGARELTGNFGYPGRPETSTNTDLDSIAGQLSGKDAINAAVNYAVADTSVPYPQSADDVTVSTAAVDYGDEGSRRQTLYGMRSGNKDYDRFTRGGGGYAFMPAYMRQFMTGENFDVTAKRIQLADGSIAYETPDGRILSPEQFGNTAQTVGALTVEGPEQQYEKGYSITDAAGNVTYYTPDGQITDSIA